MSFLMVTTVVLLFCNHFMVAASYSNVYANILGTSVHSDGKSGFITAPNGLKQEGQISQAFKMTKISPCDVDYIEVHGTCTAL